MLPSNKATDHLNLGQGHSLDQKEMHVLTAVVCHQDGGTEYLIE